MADEPPEFPLTQAEFEIAQDLGRGRSPKEIAYLRGTSLHTVRTQIKHAKRKLDARTINELVAIVQRRHLNRR